MKTPHMKLPKMGRHGDTKPKFHPRKLSIAGGSAYGAPPGGMAFTPPGGGGPALGPPANAPRDAAQMPSGGSPPGM